MGGSSPAGDARRLVAALRQVVLGQEAPTRDVVVCLLARGHALLEGVPGTAKTLLVRTLALALNVKFQRIQFTPDLMPADITGISMLTGTQEFRFRPGPIFADLVLADEINRAPAKTQAALLEAMEERQVTADGTRMPLGDRFLVIATQNPVEFEGTYPLPEAQLDRFFLKLEVPVPGADAEAELLRRVDRGFSPLDLGAAGLRTVVGADLLRAARADAAAVRVTDGIISYITQLCGATRTSPDLLLGCSPRGAIALLAGGKAMAAIAGRDYVIPEDVKDLCVPALRHRLVRRPEAELAGVTEVAAVERAVARVPVPR